MKNAKKVQQAFEEIKAHMISSQAALEYDDIYNKEEIKEIDRLIKLLNYIYDRTVM